MVPVPSQVMGLPWARVPKSTERSDVPCRFFSGDGPRILSKDMLREKEQIKLQDHIDQPSIRLPPDPRKLRRCTDISFD